MNTKNILLNCFSVFEFFSLLISDMNSKKPSLSATESWNGHKSFKDSPSLKQRLVENMSVGGVSLQPQVLLVN